MKTLRQHFLTYLITQKCWKIFYFLISYTYSRTNLLLISAQSYAFGEATNGLRVGNYFRVCKVTVHLNFDCIIISLYHKRVLRIIHNEL